MKMEKTVLLCGFMGCGKSAVGKALAALLSADFCDMDDFIVRRDGRSVPQIFAQSGEEEFRRLETDAIRELSLSGGVVACGGGAVLRAENTLAASENGIIVFIDTPFEICRERIVSDKNRPLAASRSEKELRELFEARRPVYSSAAAITVSGKGSVNEISNEIMSRLQP